MNIPFVVPGELLFKSIFGIAILFSFSGCGPRVPEPPRARPNQYSLWIDNRQGSAGQISIGSWRLDLPADSILRDVGVPVPATEQEAALLLNGVAVSSVYTKENVDINAYEFTAQRTFVLDVTGKRCYTARNIRYKSKNALGAIYPTKPDINLTGEYLYSTPEMYYFLQDPPKDLPEKVAVDIFKYLVSESGCPPPPTTQDKLSNIAKGMMIPDYSNRVQDIIKRADDKIKSGHAGVKP